MKSGNLNFLEPSGSLQASNRTALPLPIYLDSSVRVIVQVMDTWLYILTRWITINRNSFNSIFILHTFYNPNLHREYFGSPVQINLLRIGLCELLVDLGNFGRAQSWLWLTVVDPRCWFAYPTPLKSTQSSQDWGSKILSLIHRTG
jgi:hypothetical protein